MVNLVVAALAVLRYHFINQINCIHDYSRLKAKIPVGIDIGCSEGNEDG
jgi:cell division protein FtsB